MSKEQITALLASLEITVSATFRGFGPREDDPGWQGFHFQATLSRKGRNIWTGIYSMGSGHVDLSLSRFRRVGLTEEENRIREKLLARPSATVRPEYQDRYFSMMGKLATAQGLQPSPPDVVYSLLMDASGAGFGVTFEEWAAEYGYDTDSRKAEKAFQACRAVAEALHRAFTGEELDQLREAFADY